MIISSIDTIFKSLDYRTESPILELYKVYSNLTENKINFVMSLENFIY
jgi:hypothetical protein